MYYQSGKKKKKFTFTMTTIVSLDVKNELIDLEVNHLLQEMNG